MFGVIEGFYGDPWSHAERLTCIDAMAGWGANAYVWAPKSEPRHRDAWADAFTAQEVTQFAELIARDERVMVSIALTPGSTATIDDITAKLGPVVAAGCRTVTLCFDDLPVLDAAAHHRDLANATAAAMDVDVWLVPTHYMGTNSSAYLDTLIDGLSDRVRLMWTGVSVVADSIPAEHAAARAQSAGGRLPLLWDNVPVNDGFMGGYLHLGPYVGREAGLRDTVSGVLLNPMLSMRASLPTLESACAWWRGDDPIEAWRSVVDRDGWRVLAEATAFPGDAHWPGDRPGREWLAAVAALADHGDPDIDPWIDAARAGGAHLPRRVRCRRRARSRCAAQEGHVEVLPHDRCDPVVAVASAHPWRRPAVSSGGGGRRRWRLHDHESVPGVHHLDRRALHRRPQRRPRRARTLRLTQRSRLRSGLRARARQRG